MVQATNAVSHGQHFVLTLSVVHRLFPIMCGVVPVATAIKHLEKD